MPLENYPSNPTTLSEVYFRVGGPHVGKADIALEVNRDNVLIDHHFMTVNLGAGTIDHVVNGVGGPADTTRVGAPVYIADYP
jgi:hypothetical protein